MVPTLLWRCPLCKTHDALIEQGRWVRPSLVRCAACRTVWELIRVAGGLDYRLKVVQGDEPGLERPLAEWYDLVKADLRLEPVDDFSVALETGEALYLKSKAVQLVARRDDPLFEGAFASAEAPSPASNSHWQVMEQLGVGTLFLTDQRLMLRVDGKDYSFWLRSLSAVWLEVDRALIIRYQGQFYLLRFATESLLKWLAYIKLAMQPIEVTTGLQAYVSYD